MSKSIKSDKKAKKKINNASTKESLLQQNNDDSDDELPVPKPTNDLKSFLETHVSDFDFSKFNEEQKAMLK